MFEGNKREWERKRELNKRGEYALDRRVVKEDSTQKRSFEGKNGKGRNCGGTFCEFDGCEVSMAHLFSHKMIFENEWMTFMTFRISFYDNGN